MLGLLRQQLTGGNPYGGWTPERMVDAAAGTDPDSADEFAYSNFGYATLGTALSGAAATSYGDLLDRRLLQPLGMTATRVVSDEAALPAGRARGSTGTGQPRAPWLGSGYAPAGVGVWSTARDMATLVQAVVRDEAPGSDATQPRTDIGDGRRIGLAWITDDHDGRQVTWHNGRTGGFSSWVGFDRAAQRGALVLSASDRRVDQLGLHFLDAAPEPATRGRQFPGPTGLLLLGLLPLAAWTAWSAGRRLRRGDTDDRLTVLRPLADVAALLAIAWSFGPWLEVPWWVWSIVAAVCAVGTLHLVDRMRRLPLIAQELSRGRLALGVAHVALSCLIVLAIVV
ncbi:hypothetical protein BH23ACT10_BH23ACT10_28420 [soil metagenome]